MSSGIYKIENNITHNIYIGKAKDFDARWRQHKYEATHNRSNNHLYNAMKKYGIDNFTFSIVEEMSLTDYINFGAEKEKYWIEYYNAYQNHDNYNETSGGEGVNNWTPSLEWREKMSKIKKEWYQTEEGKLKAKQQSEMMKGKTLTKGIPHTEEWKKQHSEQVKGEKHPFYGTHQGGKKCLCIELNQIFESTRHAEQVLGISHTGIAAACRGEYKTSGGYHWKYIEKSED